MSELILTDPATGLRWAVTRELRPPIIGDVFVSNYGQVKVANINYGPPNCRTILRELPPEEKPAFAVGQRVRCVSTAMGGGQHWLSLRVGATYTIMEPPTRGYYCGVGDAFVVNDNGRVLHYPLDCFEAVEDAPEATPEPEPQVLVAGGWGECVEHYDGGLTLGRAYLIMKSYTDINGDAFVEVRGDHGDSCNCYARRFRPCVSPADAHDTPATEPQAETPAEPRYHVGWVTADGDSIYLSLGAVPLARAVASASESAKDGWDNVALYVKTHRVVYPERPEPVVEEVV